MMFPLSDLVIQTWKTQLDYGVETPSMRGIDEGPMTREDHDGNRSL